VCGELTFLLLKNGTHCLSLTSLSATKLLHVRQTLEWDIRSDRKGRLQFGWQRNALMLLTK